MKQDRPIYDAETLKSWGDVIRPVYMNYGMGMAVAMNEKPGMMQIAHMDRLVALAIDQTENQFGRKYPADERHALEAFFDTFIGTAQMAGLDEAHELGCFICDMDPKRPGQKWKKQTVDKYNKAWYDKYIK